ncbi:MAG: hypothetical protein R6X05_04820 [Desulfobacterales bacterium]
MRPPIGEDTMVKTGWKFTLHRPLAAGLALLLVLAGCVGSGAVITNTSPVEALGVERILVLPFQDMYKVFGANMSYRCPLCDSVYEIETVTPGADDFLTEQLMAALTARGDFELIPPDAAGGVVQQLVSPDGRPLPPLALLQDVGREMDADAILLGRVYRFEERIGAKFSAQRPASVTFDLLLIRVADGRILWTGRFEETQKSLSENLFNLGTFVRRGARWISAQEMAQTGLEQMLQTFPKP